MKIIIGHKKSLKTDVKPGVYFYCLKANAGIISKKMTIVR